MMERKRGGSEVCWGEKRKKEWETKKGEKEAQRRKPARREKGRETSRGVRVCESVRDEIRTVSFFLVSFPALPLALLFSHTL